MITIGLDPVLVSFGHFSVRWYGLVIAIAILAGLAVTLKEAGRRGLPTNGLLSLALYGVLAGVAGARLAHVVDRLDYYLANPVAILALHEGGLAIWGGLLGGLAAAVVYAYLRRLPFLRFADALAPALAVGTGIGRIACTINGDAWGAPAGEAWGLVYTNPNSYVPAQLLGVPTHPVPLYELVWNLLVFALLWALRKKVKTDGALFGAFVILYSLGRLAFTFWRQNEAFLFGLQEAQVISLAAILVAIPAMAYLLLRQQGTSRSVLEMPS